MWDKNYALSFGTAMLVCACVVYWIVKTNWSWAMDVPGSRSLHSHPVPRSGGLGILVGITFSGLVLTVIGAPWLWVETGLAGALCLLSLVDDRRGLPVSIRLPIQIGVAASYAWLMYSNSPGSGASLPPWLWLPLALLTIVAMSNFFNFMDGANGLAGGMGAIGFTAYAVAAAVNSQTALALLCLAIAGSASGFLLFNWTGRIFMGDGGSVPLGFLAASVGLYGWLVSVWAVWFPVLIFAPFIADAAVTLLKRLVRGDRVWEAHREHYYQRVIRMGASHARLAFSEYALMLCCAAGALALPNLSAMWRTAVLAAIGVLFTLLMLVVDARWRHRSTGQSF